MNARPLPAREAVTEPTGDRARSGLDAAVDRITDELRRSREIVAVAG